LELLLNRQPDFWLQFSIRSRWIKNVRTFWQLILWNVKWKEKQKYQIIFSKYVHERHLLLLSCDWSSLTTTNRFLSNGHMTRDFIDINSYVYQSILSFILSIVSDIISLSHRLTPWILFIYHVNIFFTINNLYLYFNDLGRRNQINRRRLLQEKKQKQQQQQRRRIYRIKIEYPTITGHLNMVISSERYLV
jgi:hypothetical protein